MKSSTKKGSKVSTESVAIHNSSDVKDCLLKIFSREQLNHSIDFKQEWEKAFQDINLEREQYLAAVNNLDTIQELEQMFERTLSLRGKIAACQPKVNELLQDWHGYVHTQKEHLERQKAELETEQSGLQTEDRKNAGRKEQLNTSLIDLQKAEKERESLSIRFALVPDESYLNIQLASAKREYDIQAALCVQSQRFSSKELEKQLKEREAQLISLESQRKTLGDNLYLHLSKRLDTPELEKLNKVLNSQVMQLPPEQYSLDINQLRKVLKGESVNKLSLAGLTLSLNELIPQHVQKTEQELIEEIYSVNEQIENFKDLLEASKESEIAENKKNELNRAVRQCELDLEDYQKLQQLTKSQAQRSEQKETLEQELKTIIAELDNAEQRHKTITAQINEIAGKLAQLKTDSESVEKLKNQRIDDQALFAALSDQPHTPWLLTDEWSVEYLPVRLEQYIEDCKDLDKLFKDLRQIKNDLAQKGLTKFQMAQTQDEELKGIIKFSHCLDDEKKALERRARSAVVNVTASLRELRSGLYALQSKMKEFNRLISHRQLSDLKTFKIEPVEESQLVDAMNVLIQQAEQTESGQSFELFDQGSVLDDVELDRAKGLLIEEGNARQGLRVADLFRLEFVVAKQGQQQESFEEIDSAASNGTVLMAKLVTGLAMLHLMQDKRHQMKAVCYLDEALALDTKNQANLIEIANQFGFALIFASPAPLTTARYCVPIHQANGKNHVSRNCWQMFEPIASQERPQSQVEPLL
ncbi:hypothetical protein A1OU_21170 [Enterovibrio norvegicus]|nr:hypothetical protein A1OU_21170 [Enterovibrio norvegicus]